ncbi:unnamed protein product [Moneuplotes crassus]|uniref:Uncharacterized protein n=1 Tax=Euplotes crassus TaxID=5936 RepID=A0AAD1X5B3_EUPCR|nr:unnamed protein product [Moneuplotes crassus]
MESFRPRFQKSFSEIDEEIAPNFIKIQTKQSKSRLNLPREKSNSSKRSAALNSLNIIQKIRSNCDLKSLRDKKNPGNELQLPIISKNRPDFKRRDNKIADKNSFVINKEFIQQIRNANMNKIFPNGFSSCSSDSLVSKEEQTIESRHSLKRDQSKHEPEKLDPTIETLKDGFDSFNSRRESTLLNSPHQPRPNDFNFIVPTDPWEKRRSIMHNLSEKRHKKESSIIEESSYNQSVLSEMKKSPRTRIRDATKLSMFNTKKLIESPLFNNKSTQNRLCKRKMSFWYKLDSIRRKPQIEISMSGIFKKKKDEVNLNISSCKLNTSERPKIEPKILHTCQAKKSTLKPSKIKRPGKLVYTIKANSEQNYHKISTRLHYKRKINFELKPLLIIYYDGILGFTRKQRLYVRPKVDKFLSKMSKNFQIVIVKCGSISDSNVILDTVLKKHPIDAFYCLNPNTSDTTFVFFDQIYKDFKIPAKAVDSRVHCLTSLNVDDAEYSSNMTEEVLFNQPFQKHKITTQLNISCVPLPSKTYSLLPKCHLLKNFQSDTTPKPLNLSLPTHPSPSKSPLHSSFCTTLIYSHLLSLRHIRQSLAPQPAQLHTLPSKPTDHDQFPCKKSSDFYKKLLKANSKIKASISSYQSYVKTKKPRKVKKELWEEYVDLRKEFRHFIS